VKEKSNFRKPAALFFETDPINDKSAKPVRPSGSGRNLTILPSLPLHRSDNTFRDFIEAPKIKEQYALSYADCFAVATAWDDGGNE
jgi:hypothetical protein